MAGKPTYSKDNLRDALLKHFAKVKRPFTANEFVIATGISASTLSNRFGSFNAALDEVGLRKKFNEFKLKEIEIKNFDPTKKLDEDFQREKQKLLDRAKEKEVKALREMAKKTNIIVENIRESMAKLDRPIIEVHPIAPTPKKAKLDGHKTLWFEFSDLQLGTLVTKEELGGLNEHNWVIWKKKLEIWKKAVIAMIARYKTQYHIDHVVIACLGDMVEGQEIFSSQKWSIDKHVADQALYGAQDSAAAFIEIFESHPELDFHVPEVFGNHGRPGKKGADPYSCSWDKIYQRFLQLYVEKAGVKNVVFHQNEAWFYLVEIYGWNHLLLHGDQGMGGLWSSSPTVNGLQKGSARYSQMMQQQVHFLHIGHFHNDWQLSFNLSQLLVNGSWIGTSNFSATQMVAASPPIQTMHVFDPRVGLEKTERIHLTEENVKKPMPPAKFKK